MLPVRRRCNAAATVCCRYDLLRRCWQFEPDDRPSFHDIYRQLQEFKARPLQAPAPHYVKSTYDSRVWCADVTHTI